MISAKKRKESRYALFQKPNPVKEFIENKIGSFLF